jgi:hypothetical protein
MTIPNFRAFLFAKVDSVITFWLVEFNFGVGFSIYIDQLTTRYTAWVSHVYHAINSSSSQHMVWRCCLSHYMITPECLFWTPAMKSFTALMLRYISKESVRFRCLSNVNYTLLMLFLNCVNWTKQQWPMSPITCRHLLITFLFILLFRFERLHYVPYF